MIFSVVIPVYNTLEYLPQCLESIERQRFQDMEILLIDDGSTDGSSDYCDKYKKEHSNVVVLHKENGGASDSRNVGLLAASGEYIHFIDSDDVLLGDSVYSDFLNTVYPEKPEVLLARFEEYTPDFSRVEGTQTVYKTEGLFEGDILKEVLKNKYSATLTSPVNKIFQRSFLLDNNLFFTQGIDHEEDEWLPRVLSLSKRTWFSNDIIYGVRKGRAGSLSESLNEETILRKACSKIRIASSGIKYMTSKNMSADTLALVSEYYWDYLVDACVVCNNIEYIKYKRKIYEELNRNRSFFDSYKYLSNKNRRLLGIMFKTLGVRITVKVIGLRYGK